MVQFKSDDCLWIVENVISLVYYEMYWRLDVKMMQYPLIIVPRKHAIIVICLIIFAFSNFTVISPNSSQATAQVQNMELRTKTHEYTLVAEETTLEIAPDVRVDAWTYNGTIPGPTLTATEGDRVIIHFINKTPLPHTIHLHGDHPSQEDGVFELVPPNGAYTYDFIAEPAGALAYHCHVPPVMQHVRMGLYGAFIVYPKTPLPPAREYVIVSGEYDTQNQLNPVPEYYMFNGYVEQYQTHPPPAKTNETVRIYLINLGMSPAY